MNDQREKPSAQRPGSSLHVLAMMFLGLAVVSYLVGFVATAGGLLLAGFLFELIFYVAIGAAAAERRRRDKEGNEQ